jgi:hypothetical protein
VLLDAHNAYVENGKWSDRLDRALATGLPIATEQDLVWIPASSTAPGRSVVSHGPPVSGSEPTLEEYFFTRIAPLVENALQENRRDLWPVITLNLDFKTDEPEHHEAVWDVLGRYEKWLVTAQRTTAGEIAPLRSAPLLVLTGEADSQEQSFHEMVPIGGTLRLFGAAHARPGGLPGARTNYRRWANYPWSAVELEGQPAGGQWTADDERRLHRLVDAAHAAGLWIRFYTLNGHDPADTSMGWTPSYNFGALDAVRTRWAAAVSAGVDFVATDQYEAFATARQSMPEVRTLVLEGVLNRADYERLLEREFEVPSGTEHLEIGLSYDDRERTVIDLGLRGPAGFRGWSGGGTQQIFVATHSASYGYTPGPLEPGRWAVVLGVPNIREAVTTAYRLEIKFSAAQKPHVALSNGSRWYAGDLHSHSGHSDGRTLTGDGRRLRVPPYRVFDAAARARLDFVALTDHNTASHWADVDRLQPLYPGVLLLHGREITTYRGHFNAIGEQRFVDFRLGPSRSIASVAADVSRAGAFISINHPTRPDDEGCMGCGWNDGDADTMSHFQGVEILNGDGNGDLLAGWRYWARMLNRGHRLVAIGGSDEHTPDETADRRMGMPTTVVYASELSERAVVAGLRSGRVYIRTRGVDGPEVELAARRDTALTQMGGTIAPGRITLEVRTRRAGGQRIEWIRNGEVEKTETIPADGAVALDVDARSGSWFSVILRDTSAPTTFTNAIFVGSPQ